MPTRILALALLAAGCGTVKDRSDCSVSSDCPAGEWCAQTSEGNVCWPDGVSPTIAALSVTCAGGCVRDGQLVVTADVADDQELLYVGVTTDLDPLVPFPLTHQSGTTWTGTIPLSQLPFPAFEREVVVSLAAQDGARNVTITAATDRPVVTRVRWSYDTGAALSAAAVTAQGDVVVARDALTNQLVAVHPDGTLAWTLSLGSGSVTAPPSIGAQAIWVGANDGKLYAVKLDGSGELTSRSCTASGVAKGPPAVLTTAGVDVAFGAFANGRIYASGPTCVPTAALVPAEPFSGGVAVGAGQSIFAASSTATSKALRQFLWDGEAFASGWTATLADTSAAPLAIDGSGSVLSGSVGGELERSSGGSAASISALANSIDASPIVLANGDIVVGDAGGKLHRLAPDGAAVWGAPVDLGAAVHAPMALAGGGTSLLVATADGKVHALDGTGAVLWSGALTAGMALGAGAIQTPAGAPLAPDGGPISTAYFGGADGRLYAVVVDGGLDTAAPWPKAWHDARNTSRAGGAF